jgi:Na+/proline symporter
LLGGLALAVFWKRGHAVSLISGMLTSLAVMTAIQVLPTSKFSSAWWKDKIGTEIFWPWYTLIGLVITLVSAAVVEWTMFRKDSAVQG